MWLQLLFVLLAIIVGARVGGIGLGVFGGLGLAILTFVFGLEPTTPPIDVMLMIVAVILLFMIVMAIARRSEAGDGDGAVVYIPSSESEGLAFVLCCLSLLGGGLYLRHIVRKGDETERSCKR